MKALLAIKGFASEGGFTILQLSERLQVKHHSAVDIVDRLVERKLITREPARKIDTSVISNSKAKNDPGISRRPLHGTARSKRRNDQSVGEIAKIAQEPNKPPIASGHKAPAYKKRKGRCKIGPKFCDRIPIESKRR
jgi:hypothetical protein